MINKREALIQLINDRWLKDVPGLTIPEEIADFIIACERELEQSNASLKDLLEKCANIFDEMDAITWDEDSGWQGSSYDEVAEEVREALELIDENGGE